MKNFIKSIDELSWVAKLILCLPIINIVWAVYRIAKSYYAQNTLGIILGIVWVLAGATILWAFDLVCVILNKNIWWIC